MTRLTKDLDEFKEALDIIESNKGFQIISEKACDRFLLITTFLFVGSISFFTSYSNLPHVPHDCETYNSFAGGIKIGNSSTTFYQCEKVIVGRKKTYNCRNVFNQKTIYKLHDNRTVCTFYDDYTEKLLDYPTNIYGIYYDKSHKCYLHQNENLNSCNISYIMLSFGALFFIICLIIQISCNPCHPLCRHTFIKCCMGLPSKITPDNSK